MNRLIAKLIPRKQDTILLGRWGMKPPDSTKEMISVFWANSDHCGGVECIDGQRNKELLDCQSSISSDRRPTDRGGTCHTTRTSLTDTSHK